jgi:translation initiation factor IF-2
MSSNQNEKIVPRPPIVVIMGHIDHGKSTLLDYIRNTSTTLKEAGGITQHISAYEADASPKDNASSPENEKRKITFLDTPGHEAFRSVRKSGSKVADIAVLVVSAEDGVKPQTIEALECIREDKIPFIVAINKIDKPNANIDKTKQELAEKEVLVEGWGGQVPVVNISAKTGEGVNDLLETILLQGDLEELSSNAGEPASGYVLESNLDMKKGISATLVVKNGTLTKGMYVAANGAITPIRSIVDFTGKSIDSASLSKPVSIMGWNKVPETGAKFISFTSKPLAEKAVQAYEDEKNSRQKDVSVSTAASSAKLLPIVIKSDVLGSLQAVEQELAKLGNDRIALKVISSGLGPVNESDVSLTISSPGALIVGFHVKVDNAARDLALRQNIEPKTFDIIYELIDWVREILKERTPKEEIEEITGTAKIIRVFSANRTKQIIGGTVETGEILADEVVKIIRRDAEIGEGKIKELQSKKVKTGTVTEGSEFGMMIDSKTEIVAGDRLQAYKKVTR